MKRLLKPACFFTLTALAPAIVLVFASPVNAQPSAPTIDDVSRIAPFLAILVGGVALFFVLRAWVLKGSAPKQEPVNSIVTNLDPDQVYHQWSKRNSDNTERDCDIRSSYIYPGYRGFRCSLSFMEKEACLKGS